MAKINFKDLSREFQEKIKAKLSSKNLPKKRHKYNAKKISINGYKFDSKKEGARYVSLHEMKKLGAIDLILRQPILDLDHGVTYRPDFLIMKKVGELWEIYFEDVKGFETKEFKLKKKLVEGKHDIEINLV